jgi:hypothetical protein
VVLKNAQLTFLLNKKTSLENIEREIHPFRKLGYTSFQAVEQSRIHLSQAPHPPREGQCVAQRFEAGSSGLFGSELKGKWKSRHDILRQYRFIRPGYFLGGDDGIILIEWRFRGAGLLNKVTRRFVRVALFVSLLVSLSLCLHAEWCQGGMTLMHATLSNEMLSREGS